MKKLRKQLPELNAGSMADIAFLLLVFFLVTTTLVDDWGIPRELPPHMTHEEPTTILERNLLEVLVNSKGVIMIRGKETPLNQVKDVAKEFIANASNRPDLPEVVVLNVPELGEMQTTKHVISLQHDATTRYGTYINVQNELAAAYRELRDELATARFGKSFKELMEDQDVKNVQAIKMVFPQRVSEAEPKISEMRL